MSLSFIDLAAQQERIRDRLDLALAKVLDHGAYVMGPEVKKFEQELATFGQAERALSCGNGTDAIALPLMAWEVGPGDAVFCPSFTFAATAEVIPWTQACPVFVDILPDTYNIDPAALEVAIEAVLKDGRLSPKVVIAVDLFGQPADYPALAEVTRRYGMKLIADSAQGFGCTLHGMHPLHWSDAATASFFPAKPLGCYGDGGAVLTNSATDFDRMDSLRVHGKAVGADLVGAALDHDPKYLNMRIGMNSRLDTLQAAVLLEKLAIFAEEVEGRNRVADRYAEGLRGCVQSTPAVIAGGKSVWAQYVIEHPERDRLAAHLKARGVPTAVYYPVPLHMQPAYQEFQAGWADLPVSEAKAKTVLALPMHPYLTASDQDEIIGAVQNFV